MNERRKGSPQEGRSIEFVFEKSRLFRVIHVDGAYGGLTPRGDIQMALFSEYTSLPEVITHAVELGQIGKELSREGKRGLVRELEIQAVMSLGTATALRDWLGDKIEKARQAQQQQEEKARQTR